MSPHSQTCPHLSCISHCLLKKGRREAWRRVLTRLPVLPELGGADTGRASRPRRHLAPQESRLLPPRRARGRPAEPLSGCVCSRRGGLFCFCGLITGKCCQRGSEDNRGAGEGANCPGCGHEGGLLPSQGAAHTGKSQARGRAVLGLMSHLVGTVSGGAHWLTECGLMASSERS